jgi:hypothetical protein
LAAKLDVRLDPPPADRFIARVSAIVRETDRRGISNLASSGFTKINHGFLGWRG